MKILTEVNDYRISCRLHQILVEKGMTIEELATLSRLDLRTLSAYAENFFRRIDCKVVLLISAVTGAEVGDIFYISRTPIASVTPVAAVDMSLRRDGEVKKTGAIHKTREVADIISGSD